MKRFCFVRDYNKTHKSNVSDEETTNISSQKLCQHWFEMYKTLLDEFRFQMKFTFWFYNCYFLEISESIYKSE